MKLLLVDDDREICGNIETLLVENGYEAKSYLYGNEESGECGLQKALQGLTAEDYILMDLFLDEQVERTVALNKIRSVTLASGLSLPQEHIIFYSNCNVREIDPLFKMVPGCHYLPIRGETFERNGKAWNSRYERNRKDFLQKIRAFTDPQGCH